MPRRGQRPAAGLASTVISQRAAARLAAEAPSSNLVLVVADDPVVAGQLVEALEEAGYTVRAIDSAQKARAAVRIQVTRAIVLDLGLRSWSGAALLRDLRADPATAAVPVIAVSTDVRRLTPEVRLRAAAVVTLPFTFRRVVVPVDEAIGAAVQASNAPLAPAHGA